MCKEDHKHRNLLQNLQGDRKGFGRESDSGCESGMIEHGTFL